MACNCKKKYETLKQYADNNPDLEKVVNNPFMKILRFVLQIGFGILCGAVFIVMVIPFLIYVIISMMFGKEINLNITKINKAIKGKK